MIRLHTFGSKVAIVAVVILFCGFVLESPAFRQKPNEVVTREPGERLLASPKPISSFGHEHLPFALLSQSVYRRNPDPNKQQQGNCLDPDALLQAMHWLRWEKFPTPDIQQQFARVHLRVEVWSNRDDGKVTVAFAGTIFTNLQDWKANLRWFIPRRDDEYTVVVQIFGREFVNEYLRLQDEPDGAFLKYAKLYSTGHSLGGGLAQQFAYSLPIVPGMPRVEKVYAFDPSPVTGFYSVREEVRNQNKQKLCIDRIYERHEILAILRALESVVYPPTAKAPSIRQVRYNLFPSLNPIAGHSIASFTCKLKEQLG